MTIIVYSTPSCPYCQLVKEFLYNHNIPFEDVDVSQNQEAAQEMVMKSGQTGVPVIDIEGTIIVGFDEAAIRQTLGIYD